MRGCAAFVAILMLTIALSACGKYGPPVRYLPPPPEVTELEPVAPEATVPQPTVPEEEISEPADFDDADLDEADFDEEFGP
jgi:predicted small lipoprotein YifL